MANEPGKALAISPSTLLMRRDVGAIRRALDDKLMISDATMIVSRMLRCYPNGGAQAGGGYIGALAAVLVSYPRIIAEQSADPVKGVPSETRFLPTPADVIAWCERAVTELRKPVERDDFDKAAAREREEVLRSEQQLAAARAARPTLQQMQDKHGPNWGLTEAPKEDLRVKEARTAKLQQANRDAFEAECRAAGIDPARGVSPELVRMVGEQQERMADRLAEQAAE